MRQRSVFIGPSSRPANQPPKPEFPTKKQLQDDQTAFPLLLLMILFGVVFGVFGVRMVLANDYQHLNKQQRDAYRAYVVTWHHEVLPIFGASTFTLLINDSNPIYLTSSSKPTKSVVQGNSDVDGQKVRSRHTLFSVNKLLQLYFPIEGRASQPLTLGHMLGAAPYSHVEDFSKFVKEEGEDEGSGDTEDVAKDEEQGEQSQHPLVRARALSPERQISMPMLAESKLTLKILAPVKGADGSVQQRESYLDLGEQPFVRSVIAPSRNPRDCNRRQWGSYDSRDGTCLVVEFLSELCYKIQEDEEKGVGYYQLDTSFGSAGCSVSNDYQAQEWKRVQVPMDQKTLHRTGRAMLLPKTQRAREATKLTIRHASDPELQEKQLMHLIMREKEPLIAGYMVGLGMVCVSIMWVSSLLIVTMPQLSAIWKGRSRDEDDD